MIVKAITCLGGHQTPFSQILVLASCHGQSTRKQKLQPLTQMDLARQSTETPFALTKRYNWSSFPWSEDLNREERSTGTVVLPLVGRGVYVGKDKHTGAYAWLDVAHLRVAANSAQDWAANLPTSDLNFGHFNWLLVYRSSALSA
ncbi:hypothetical protein RRG08_049578 [Elysia crispata]|uniref:Uncharacterized protein n=1 Tax=Elysia crispata TaxID=231223 RepID=A0AAE1AUL3_9GAST|nr:hypothetical protein RRG08_049578 [Elysia crispata]